MPVDYDRETCHKIFIEWGCNKLMRTPKYRGATFELYQMDADDIEVIVEMLEKNTPFSAFADFLDEHQQSVIHLKLADRAAIQEAFEQKKKLVRLCITPSDVEATSHWAELFVEPLSMGDVTEKYHQDIVEWACNKLMNTPSITSAKFSLAGMDDDDIEVIVEMLKKNKSITHLRIGLLHGAPFTNKGICSIAAFLETNNTLIDLALQCHCGIDNTAAIAIGEALKKNETLVRLCIAGSSIADNGVQAIAEALEHNQTLQCLEFYDNVIQDEGALALAKMVLVNNSLTTLNMRELGISNFEPLCSAIHQRKGLAAQFVTSVVFY